VPKKARTRHARPIRRLIISHSGYMIAQAFDIQSGRRETFERQREFTRKDDLIGELNSEKFGKNLQNMNKCLDSISIEKSTGKQKNPKGIWKVITR
jgi:hypothetical protein